MYKIFLSSFIFISLIYYVFGSPVTTICVDTTGETKIEKLNATLYNKRKYVFFKENSSFFYILPNFSPSPLFFSRPLSLSFLHSPPLFHPPIHPPTPSPLLPPLFLPIAFPSPFPFLSFFSSDTINQLYRNLIYPKASYVFPDLDSFFFDFFRHKL